MSKSFTEKIPVRFADLDAYNHVNNAVYFTYLETARTNVFKDVFNKLMAEGILLIVVKADCNYFKPITLNDNVYVKFTISEKGRTSFLIEYEIHDGESVTFATASTKMVCVDKRSGRPIKVPDDLTAFL